MGRRYLEELGVGCIKKALRRKIGLLPEKFEFTHGAEGKSS